MTYAILNNEVHSHAFQFLYAFKDGLNWFVLITFISIAVIPSSTSKSGISKGALAGIVVGTVAGAVVISAVVSLLKWRFHMNKYTAVSKRRRSEYLIITNI